MDGLIRVVGGRSEAKYAELQHGAILMAKEADLTLLRSGALDLSHCDFTAADLSDQVLPNRDFQMSTLSAAKAIGADLRDGIFLDAMLTGIQAQGANLMGAKFQFKSKARAYNGLESANFAGANLIGATFKDCNLKLVDFQGAHLEGANFISTKIDPSTKWEGAITDEKTIFDKVELMRDTARFPAFRFYEFDKGSLKRKSNAEAKPAEAPARREDTTIDSRSRQFQPTGAENTSLPLREAEKAQETTSALPAELAEKIPDLIEILVRLKTDLPLLQREARNIPDRLGVGGNGPPEEIDETLEIAIRAVDVAHYEVEQLKPRINVLGLAKAVLKRTLATLGRWAGEIGSPFRHSLGSTAGHLTAAAAVGTTLVIVLQRIGVDLTSVTALLDLIPGL